MFNMHNNNDAMVHLVNVFTFYPLGVLSSHDLIKLMVIIFIMMIVTNVLNDKGNDLLCLCPPHPFYLMLESHERILRRIIRRFGSFPTRTYSNRIFNDANVRITYEERSGRVLNLNKTCA